MPKKTKKTLKINDPELRLLSVDDVAAQLGVAVYTVRKLIWSKTLECVRVGRRVNVSEAALGRFGAQNRA